MKTKSECVHQMWWDAQSCGHGVVEVNGYGGGFINGSGFGWSLSSPVEVTSEDEAEE